MALSNPLRPPSMHIPGRVGLPLPGVQVKLNPLSADQKTEVNQVEGTVVEMGQLLIKSPAMFKEYFDMPQATKSSFDSNGWFLTGDVVALHKDGTYSIIGRESVDIIKSGGYKISALDIERELLAHPNIKEVAVVGVPHPEYGQTICAIIARADEKVPLTADDVQKWCEARLAKYKWPRQVVLVSSIPRNAMGKVNKKDLAQQLQLHKL